MAKKRKAKAFRPSEEPKGRKGHKCLRGVANNIYGEAKKKITLSLTPTAIAGLDQLSRQRDLCRSELLERIGRALISLHDPEQDFEP